MAVASRTKTTVAPAVLAIVVLASLISPILTTYGLPSDESKAEKLIDKIDEDLKMLRSGGPP